MVRSQLIYSPLPSSYLLTDGMDDHTLLSGQPCWLPLQPTDPRPVTHLLNAPLDNERPHVYHYNPASLDIGYPAIN
ncbi:hypothetical protein ANCDUO_22553 [Ancylostoma duodenale]|uniref:Uncharacterized protein n=1 Tax=Ancylostoma duodenale TaxID=51022 RepID=A0A0C2FKW2_9BILA|nr:hypothetical protein ANCDUO_22553 [Ancylostoma duodenale]